MMEKLKPYAPLFIRIGLGIVFILFGYHKLSAPEQNRAEIEELFGFGPGSTAAINYYTGLVEIVIGLALIAGFYMKYAAPLATLMLAVIFIAFTKANLESETGTLSDPNLYRDIGLTGAAISLWLTGAGPWSLDNRKKQALSSQP